jgi:hypothetical protein
VRHRRPGPRFDDPIGVRGPRIAITVGADAEAGREVEEAHGVGAGGEPDHGVLSLPVGRTESAVALRPVRGLHLNVHEG